MKYVIYTRVSDKKQDDGTSPETQLEDCLAVVGNAEYIHIADTAKGWLATEKRRKLMAAIDHIHKGDVLLCRSPDRLSRNTEELGVIKAFVRRNGGRIECVIGDLNDEDCTPGEWLVKRVLGLLPEYEIRLLSSRVKRAHQKKCQDNEQLGFLRYGFKSVKGKVVAHKEQQKILALMLQWRKEGNSFRYITQKLNEQQLYNSLGKPWVYESVRQIVSKALLAEENLLGRA